MGGCQGDGPHCWAGAESDAQEFAPERGEELLSCVGDRALEQESVWSVPPGDTPEPLNAVLCHVLWDDTHRAGRVARWLPVVASSLTHSGILWAAGSTPRAAKVRGQAGVALEVHRVEILLPSL